MTYPRGASVTIRGRGQRFYDVRKTRARKSARRMTIRLAAIVAALAMAGSIRAQESASGQSGAQTQRLTLKQAVTLAIQSNHDLSLARLRYELSQRETELTRSRFRPDLYAGSGAAYTRGFPLLAGGGAPALFSLTYDQTLFDLSGRGEQRVAEQHSQEQRLEMEGVRDAVVVRVAAAYLELAKVRRESDLLQGERESARQILDYTQKRLDAGYELPIEVTKAQLTVARVEQRLAENEDQEDLLNGQLGSLLSMDPDQRIEVTAEDLPDAANQTVADLTREALENNSEIKQAESEQASSVAHLKGERGARWPTLAVIGQYNVLGKFNDYDQFFNKFERNNLIAGVEIRIPIFASRTSAEVAAAQTNLTAAHMAVENKRSELSLDVRHQARQTHVMDTGREVARLELELAQQNLEVLQAQYQQGRASIRDMETAQLDENDKWLAFLDADFARQQAQLDLLKTTGQVAKLLQ